MYLIGHKHLVVREKIDIVSNTVNYPWNVFGLAVLICTKQYISNLLFDFKNFLW